MKLEITPILGSLVDFLEINLTHNTKFPCCYITIIISNKLKDKQDVALYPHSYLSHKF